MSICTFVPTFSTKAESSKSSLSSDVNCSRIFQVGHLRGLSVQSRLLKFPILTLMRKYHTPTAPITFICLSGAQVIAHAIHHGFTHASHNFHPRFPRFLPRSPPTVIITGPTETRQRSRNSIRDCGHGVVVFSPRGFCFEISVFPKSFRFLNSSNIIYYSMCNKTRWIFYKILTLCDV